MVSSSQFLFLSCVAYGFAIVQGKTVFYEDFSKPLNVNATGSNYKFFTKAPAYANDGTLTPNSNKTLTQDVRPYKLTVPQGKAGITDHFKSIVVQKQYWNVSVGQVLTCELKTFSKQWNTNLQPFKSEVTDPFNDIRLGTCGLYFADPNTFTLGHFLQTDKENQPYHARLGFGQNKTGPLGFYHAFNTLRTGVSKRTSPYTYSTLTVQYDRSAKTLKWLADGKLVNSVSTIGIPTGNMVKLLDTGGVTTKPVDPAGFVCGFGCIDFLDFSDPLNTKNTKGLVKLVSTAGFYKAPSVFVDPASKTSSRLFGQGSFANHAYFKIDISSKARLLREGKIEE